jgi:rhomboid-like protein
MAINARLVEMPALIRPWVSLAFVSVLQPYADASEGKRLTWKICLLNAGVYLAWKVRKWQPSMNVRFMHFPLSGLSFTLLTSMFR